MVFCTPCHGRLGDGKGMVARRGFSPPPTFHSEYLRKIPVHAILNERAPLLGAATVAARELRSRRVGGWAS